MRPKINKTLDLNRFRVALFDMDGVVVNSTLLHLSAWRRTFEDFNAAYAVKTGIALAPLSDKDYHEFVSGRTGEEAVRAYLEKRAVIDWPGDDLYPSMGEELLTTIAGLKKKAVEVALLDVTPETAGNYVFRSTLDLIERLRANGVRTVLCTSSSSAPKLIKKLAEVGGADFNEYFDDFFDANVTKGFDIKSKKPGQPQIWLGGAEAQQEYDLNACVAFEDAISGVQSIKSAPNGAITAVAINRETAPGEKKKNAQSLLDAGADILVNDLAEIEIIDNPSAKPRGMSKIPFDIKRKHLSDALFLMGALNNKPSDLIEALADEDETKVSAFEKLLGKDTTNKYIGAAKAVVKSNIGM